MSLMVPPWPWKIVMIDSAMVLTLSRIQRPEQRAEAADQRVEVEGGFGWGDRDGAACRAAACRSSPRLSSM